MQRATAGLIHVIDAFLLMIRMPSKCTSAVRILKPATRPTSFAVQTNGTASQCRRCHNSGMVLREKHDPPSLESTFIRDIVRRAEAKLAQLQAKKEHIHSRMHAIRYLATHAEANYVRAAESSCPSAPFPRRAVVREDASTPMQTSHFECQSKVRRACRIALMETDRPQSCAEICERIQKRGSMLFDNDDPLHIIAAHLNAMARNSEILCSAVNGETLWQRKCE
jgi:hypothetical protein